MKKKLTTIIVLLIICIQITPAHAALEFTAEPSNGNSPNMNQNDPPGTFTINGTKYLWPGEAKSVELMEYNPETYEHFKSGYEYVWTGEYYYERYSGLDNAPTQYRDPKYGQLKPIRLYDSAFNLVKEYDFQKYVTGIGYFNGYYYCRLTASVLKSVDFENWEPTDESLPRKAGNVTYMNIDSKNRISMDGTTLNAVAYENEPTTLLSNYNCGEWNLGINADRKSFSITNDNVYFINLTCAQDTEVIQTNLAPPHIFIYENGDSLVIDIAQTRSSYHCTIPKQSVYDALEAQKTAPYVCVNNTILGFETPPVTESDRTLVPMRFLFEQLGAEVTWDEATETATAVKNGTTISFSIDNTTATVNGAETVMDVPARLVGDKTMVPLRFLSEEMGYTVEWDEETRMATITTPEL